MVKKYSDGKYHASDAEAVYSQLQTMIEKAFDEDEAARMLAVAKASFDLGFQTANEYYEDKRLEDIKKYSEMESDALKKLLKVEKLLIDSYEKIDKE